ncbi:MAG: glycosyltransferase [Chloroflexota bacterium]|nr:glycosyltransferase [Chloroflexota bacterium]
MRIAIFSNAYLPSISGVVNSIRLFRKGLIAAGHDVHVFAPEYEGYEDEEPYIFRFPAIDLSDQLELSIIVPIKNLIDPALRGVKPALIHSQHPIWMGDLAVSFARDLNIPLVFTFHTQYEKYVQQYTPIAPKLAGLITEEVIKRYLWNCEHVVVPTESVREMLAKNYGIERGVSVVPTPVDLVKFQDIQPEKVRARFGLEGKEVLLFVGRLAREKGLDMLLRAFTLIREQRPEVRLLLLGRGPYEDALKAKLAKLGFKELVILAGAVPHEEVPGYYTAADLFVFPSTTETQGLVIIEAMAAGLPVVAVRAPGAVDVLTEGGGVLTENKPEAFAREVVGILADSGRQKELSEQARRAVERYSISDATARMLNAYETALDSWENRDQE